MTTNQNINAHRTETVNSLRALLPVSDFVSAERFFSAVKAGQEILGRNHCDVNALWGCAMTLRYGPTGLHGSRADAVGYPLPETMVMRGVADSMDEAARRIPILLDSYSRWMSR